MWCEEANALGGHGFAAHLEMDHLREAGGLVERTSSRMNDSALGGKYAVSAIPLSPRYWFAFWSMAQAGAGDRAPRAHEELAG